MSENIQWKAVTKVSNDIEFEMVAGILQMGNIPVLRESRDTDGIFQLLLGMPIRGLDVMVPEDRLEEARQLLESTPMDEEDGKVLENKENSDDKE